MITQLNKKKKYKNLILFIIAILIISSILSIFLISNNFYRQVEKQRKAELKQKVEIAYNAIYPIISKVRKSEITKEEARKRIADIVKNMTFHDEFSENYIFISSYDGIYLVQPFEPEKVGTSQWNYKDIKGTYVIRELVKAAKKYPQGSYVSYYSYLPHSKEYQPKLSYVKGIPEIEAYIGTGMYIQTTYKKMINLLNLQRLILISVFALVLILMHYFIIKEKENNRILEKEINRRIQLEDELMHEKEELTLKNQYLQTLFDNSPNALVQFDKNGYIVEINNSFTKIFGYTLEECKGKHIDDLITKKINYYEAKNISKEVFEKGFVETQGIRFSKNNRPLYVIIKSILIRINNKIVGGYGIYIDITPLREYQKKLDYMAKHDSLTGLYNYNYFNYLLKIKNKFNYPVGLIVFDLNGLKLINDTLGHSFGDLLLKEFANILFKSKKREDLAIRIGGDEFLLILQNVNSIILEEVKNKILQNISNFNQQSKTNMLVLSVALGFSIVENNKKSVTDALKEADENMYKDKLLNKASSKNQIINVLLAALGEKDNITKGHTERVKNMCEIIAQKLGLDENQTNNLILLAEMHDLGKVAIPDSVLNKSEPLTKEEWELIKSHSEKGYRIALASPELSNIAELILKHHERWDGRGYPLGLKGKEIPIECRILALADSYDAMTNLRPYNKVKTHSEAIEEIKKCSGKQFDPYIAQIFVEVFENTSII
ncbi:HD domain-containing phosphohydrolase [Caldicellulosiruptoraceae bacterium PP1]